MAAKKKVLVKTPKVDGMPNYFRAGFVFKRGEENVVEADPVQFKALADDPNLAVVEMPASEKP